MDSYPEMIQGMRKVFLTGKTKSLEWRRQQLEALLQFLEKERDTIAAALYKDLNKPKMEACVFEIDYCKNDLIDALNNLQEWTKPEKVKKGLLNMMDKAYIKREPFGVCLIIGAWNYPIQLTILPVIGAIAAGNCVLLKPSEVSINTATVLEKHLPQYLDNDCIKVVNGGVPETTALLKERFDHIFYTGSTMVGKIVMQAATKHLTPVVLELGGKSPVYVDSDTDLSIVAKRLMWGKCCNSGQICIAPDYVMCTKETQDALVPKIKAAIEEFFPGGVENSQDYCRIVSDRQFQRLKKLVEGSSKVALGGNMNEKERFISPTVLTNVDSDHPTMQDEIFGPVLPIMPVQNADEAVQFINSREKPLSMYVFSNDPKTITNFNTNTSSGSLCVNDTLMQAGLTSLPFGGVGHSGMGSYHGRFSYETFSHKRSVMERGLKMESANSIRYPPFSEKKMGTIKWLMTKKQKKSTAFSSILPFFVLGTVVALLFKILGLDKAIPALK